jgi:hypothetical protein
MHACSCQIGFRKGFKFCRKIRFRKVQSIFSHFLRKDTLHQSKTVYGLFGRYDYSNRQEENIFLLSIFYLIKNEAERELPSTMLLSETWWPWHPPPLLSEIMPQHDKDGGDIGEKILADSWG